MSTISIRYTKYRLDISSYRYIDPPLLQIHSNQSTTLSGRHILGVARGNQVTTGAVFILHHLALGGIKSSWRGNRIETGKNLNPVKKILRGSWNFWGKISPQKMPRINTGLATEFSNITTYAYNTITIRNFHCDIFRRALRILMRACMLIFCRTLLVSCRMMPIRHCDIRNSGK
jgi:hypothetical protein